MEHDARDIDVAALHQGWLKKAKAGGAIITDAALRQPGSTKAAGSRAAPGRHAGIIVNAAGAWADVVAKASGLLPLGVQPMRHHGRTAGSPELDVARWPLISDSAEAGTPSRRPAACKCRRTTRIRSKRMTLSSTTW